jgi:hypothetical protein
MTFFFFFGVADVDVEPDELDEVELDDEDELDEEVAAELDAPSPPSSAVPQAVEIASVMTTASRMRPRLR